MELQELKRKIKYVSRSILWMKENQTSYDGQMCFHNCLLRNHFRLKFSFQKGMLPVLRFTALVSSHISVVYFSVISQLFIFLSYFYFSVISQLFLFLRDFFSNFNSHLIHRNIMLPFNSDMLLNLDKTIQNKKKPQKTNTSK